MGSDKAGFLSAKTSMEVEHDLVLVDEFDALSIELKVDEPKQISRKDSKQPTKSVQDDVTSSSGPVPKAKYPAKLHARKVAKELGVKDGLIYLPGLETPLYEDSDMGPAFRQRRYFFYLSGANIENAAVTYDIGLDELVLWVPYIDPRQILWYGTSPSPKECKERMDVDEARYTHGLKAYLQKRLGVRSSGGAYDGHDDNNNDDNMMIGASTGSTFCREPMSKQLPAPIKLYALHRDQVPLGLEDARRTDYTKLQQAMDDARVTKTAYEIAMIRKANDISSGAHRAVLHMLKQMQNEREIEAVFVDYCTAVHGAKMQAYAVIAGSGPNAAVLHYGANNEPLAGRQLVCLDAGCEWDCYASDITRTFPINGRYTPEARSIYAAVHRMQTEVVERFQPGVPYAALHLHASLVAVEELLQLGILRGGSAHDILVHGTIAAFFPHGLGHHVGLEVHDVLSPELMLRKDAVGAAASQKFDPAKTHWGKRSLVSPDMYATLFDTLAAMAADKDNNHSTIQPSKERRKRRFLEPGMIITVEPGIYFCRPYIESFFLNDPKHARYINQEILEQYYPVGGVRIEDCILVTEQGHENLTTAPKGEEALRIINGHSV